MEIATTTMRWRTGFANLPSEINCMILEHLISDIKNDHLEDIHRWTCHRKTGSRTQSITITQPRPYHSDPILQPGQQYNSNVKVTLRANLHNESQWQTGDVTVLIPRRWNELLHSGLFHEHNMAFLSQMMPVEITCMRTRGAPYIVHGPDTHTESAVRALLAWRTGITARDLRLHALHFSDANLSCYFPWLQLLHIYSTLR